MPSENYDLNGRFIDVEDNTNYGAGNTAKLVRVLQYLNWYC